MGWWCRDFVLHGLEFSNGGMSHFLLVISSWMIQSLKCKHTPRLCSIQIVINTSVCSNTIKISSANVANFIEWMKKFEIIAQEYHDEYHPK